jgi:hypothetical protein
MNLYIETDGNGNTVNHPAFEDNLIQAFGAVPEHWEPFIRVERPVVGVYQMLDSEEPTYQKVNGVWTDVWSLRDMTDAEKTSRQQKVQYDWTTIPDASNFSAWTFDEETCSYQPPIPYPTDGKNYFWQGTTNTWQLRPPYPTDGKEYKLDFATATWVLVS